MQERPFPKAIGFTVVDATVYELKDNSAGQTGKIVANRDYDATAANKGQFGILLLEGGDFTMTDGNRLCTLPAPINFFQKEGGAPKLFNGTPPVPVLEARC